MPIITPPKIDAAKWIPILVSLAIVIAGWGGFYALTNWRLNQVEGRQIELQKINDIYVELAKINAALEGVVSRTDDDAIEDWNRWRARQDALIEQLRRDYNHIRNDVYGQ